MPRRSVQEVSGALPRATNRSADCGGNSSQQPPGAVWHPTVMKKAALPLLLLATLGWTSTAHAGVETDIEAGVVFATRNDARIPGNGGSDLSLVDDLKTSPAPAFRLRLGYRLGQRHVVTALYAPL
jgi:hypothetical protein